AFFEAERIHAEALVVADYSFAYSHWRASRSLDQWLREEGVPGIYGVDTRALTKALRERGVMLGKLAVEGCPTPEAFRDPGEENLAAQVSTRELKTFGSGPGSKRRVVLVDCGSKGNIVRCLTQRGAEVTLAPWDYDFTALAYDGVMVSNGPGNPQQCRPTIAHLRKALALGKPIFGICLGHQLLALAAGAATYKLKYGHRGHNQPVIEAGTQRAFITSQNHGYAVDAATLPDGWEPYFTNLNDGTSEGIRHRSLPFRSVQFHPEACGGPTDTEFLFDEFISAIDSRAM
ncbi:MAG: glutamine-hydrolyzing carbamoyl-phosphate synthase small subunit, partial [Prevotellaceae bacterium]|nr:glutamine-hydrolyzing carbamoyl-phosphate synthase small subunit [Prevotellaceae bacterium]